MSAAKGFEIAPSLHANEHMIKGKLAKSFMEIGLVEAYVHKFKNLGLASCFIGINKIYRMHSSKKIIPLSLNIYPFYLGVGNNQSCTVSLKINSVLGNSTMSLWTPSR